MEEKEELSKTKKQVRVVAMVFGGIFVLVGLVLIVFVGQTTTLICYRTGVDRIDCRLEGDFMGIRMRTEEIHHLQRAEVQWTSATAQRSSAYRVALVTESGKVPLTTSFTGGRDDKQEIADRINAFIANPSGQPPLEIRKWGWTGWILGLGAILFGIIAMKGVGRGRGEPWRPLFRRDHID